MKKFPYRPNVKSPAFFVFTLFSSLLVFGTLSFADVLRGHESYYPQSFYQGVNSGSLKEAPLKQALFKILSSAHLPQPTHSDKLMSNCRNQGEKCYQHTPLTYDQARAFIMGYLDLEEKGGEYQLRDVYCQKVFTKKDFSEGKGPGPGVIPDHKVFSVEHTWPQSRFSKKFSERFQKPDLHILYGVSQRANNSRGNIEFADVQIDQNPICPNVRRGWVRGNIKNAFFEPPQQHKGNVARAIFYFATRYQLPVSAVEEESLRRWHRLDPVDDEERARHEEIFKVQKVRNPFVDHPELANLISDF